MSVITDAYVIANMSAKLFDDASFRAFFHAHPFKFEFIIQNEKFDKLYIMCRSIYYVISSIIFKFTFVINSFTLVYHN